MVIKTQWNTLSGCQLKDTIPLQGLNLGLIELVLQAKVLRWKKGPKGGVIIDDYLLWSENGIK